MVGEQLHHLGRRNVGRRSHGFLLPSVLVGLCIDMLPAKYFRRAATVVPYSPHTPVCELPLA